MKKPSGIKSKRSIKKNIQNFKNQNFIKTPLEFFLKGSRIMIYDPKGNWFVDFDDKLHKIKSSERYI